MTGPKATLDLVAGPSPPVFGAYAWPPASVARAAWAAAHR
jgi:hypothetical protein